MHLKYKFAIQEVADTFVAVVSDEDMEKFNGLIRMNKTGKDIFELLSDDVTEEDIVAALQKKYEGSEENIRDEVHKFVAYLSDMNIL